MMTAILIVLILIFVWLVGIMGKLTEIGKTLAPEQHWHGRLGGEGRPR